MVGKKVRVLVVDDSPLMREILARGINGDAELEVVARAGDAFEARDKIITHRPDVMTCDIQMPKLNGIEFIRQLIPQYALPVIVVSSATDAVFDAMDAGAVDFVAKPQSGGIGARQEFFEDLNHKIKIAAAAKVGKGSKTVLTQNSGFVASANEKRIIAIGASTGGTEAIFSVLKGLPAGIPGIVIVQHIPPVFSTMFAERLDAQLPLQVKEAQNGDFVVPNQVLLAPGGKHMRLRRLGQRYKVDVAEGEKVNGHCPSVDVLFSSVAKAAGKNAVGVILTGMGGDGGKGLLEMRENGAKTLGQDEKSSIVYGMPKIAYQLGAVEKQVGISGMAAAIMGLLKGSGKG